MRRKIYTYKFAGKMGKALEKQGVLSSPKSGNPGDTIYHGFPDVFVKIQVTSSVIDLLQLHGQVTVL